MLHTIMKLSNDDFYDTSKYYILTKNLQAIEILLH